MAGITNAEAATTLDLRFIVGADEIALWTGLGAVFILTAIAAVLRTLTWATRAMPNLPRLVLTPEDRQNVKLILSAGVLAVSLMGLWAAGERIITNLQFRS